MSRRSLAVLAAAVVVVAAAPEVPVAAGPEPVVLAVDATTTLGPINRDLVGFGWHPGGAPLYTIASLDPHLVRIDASLQDVSTGPGQPLRLDDLLQRVAAVRAIGAEPLVILSYLPAWLGEPVALGRDPTRVKPADLDAWEEIVHDVVLALATAPAPALRFEAWNEPDVPLFWQDTPAAWVDTVERSARAVAAVGAETGVDLAFGGPATAFPDPVYLVPFVTRFRDPALPLDFVSWHYYGNYPFFGPDGTEFEVTEPIQPVLGRQNPLATPAAYPPQVDFVGGLVEAGLAGSGRDLPALILDEWNLSAAGFDRRHDTAEGAAFAAGVLSAFQDAGLDASAFFMATDTRGVPGEHGAVAVDGTRKPVWWAFDLWQRLAPQQVAVTGADPLAGVWATAAIGPRRVTVLVTAFDASGMAPADRTVSIRVDHAALTGMASIRRIDADHAAAHPRPLQVSGGIVTLTLRTPGVVLVELRVASGVLGT